MGLFEVQKNMTLSLKIAKSIYNFLMNVHSN